MVCCEHSRTTGDSDTITHIFKLWCFVAYAWADCGDGFLAGALQDCPPPDSGGQISRRVGLCARLRATYRRFADSTGQPYVQEMSNRHMSLHLTFDTAMVMDQAQYEPSLGDNGDDGDDGYVRSPCKHRRKRKHPI